MTERNTAPGATPGTENTPALLGNNVVDRPLRFGADGAGVTETGTLLLPGLVAGSYQGDYEYEQEAEAGMIDLLFADMGVPDGLTGPARMWATRQIGFQREMSRDVYTMGALQRDLWYWLGGYEQALVDLGLREPDNRNTFHS
jgi:hypothetical protein